MAKDRRYKTINQLISGGHLKTLAEIFDTLPKSVVAKDLGVSLDRFTKMINEVERFSVRNLFRMAALIEVDEILILNLVYHQHQAEKKNKRNTKG
jgi:hypothetical protein